MFYIRTLHDVILMHYHLRCMGTLFLPFLQRANDFCDFLVAFLHNIALSNWDLLLMEKIAYGEKPRQQRYIRPLSVFARHSGITNRQRPMIFQCSLNFIK